MKLDLSKKKVKQYFVVVDKDDKVKRVCWAPLLWDIPNLGYRFTGGFTGFNCRIPKFLYVGGVLSIRRGNKYEDGQPETDTR
jgi:hypothetical protein